MNKIYRSPYPYEAYPFLSDEPNDLRCDFEILTDKISSMVGLLASMCNETDIKEELLKIDELIYNLNPTMRTHLTITQEEIDWLITKTTQLQEETYVEGRLFVLPAGSKRASLAHIIRTEMKGLVRLMYRIEYNAINLKSDNEKKVDVESNINLKSNNEKEVYIEPNIKVDIESNINSTHLNSNSKNKCKFDDYEGEYEGNKVQNEVFDIGNLLSGYFFYMALKLNKLDGIEEIEYKSRNYK
ncbi:MAG: hypothetical protein LBR30_03400 [Clostridioides sp.]|nr:hypothetical protein [Clostridioides sp.]